MAAAARSEIRSIIQAAGFGTDTQSVLAQDYAISATMSELSSEREWSWLEKSATGALTAGTATVPIPTDFGAPRGDHAIRLKDPAASYAVSLTPLDPLTKVDHRTLDDLALANTPTVTGAPVYWTFTNQQLRIYPSPDKNYTYQLDYIFLPTIDLTGSDVGGTFTASEVPLWVDARFHVLIAWGAIRWLAIRGRDYQLANLASAEYVRQRQQFEQADRRSEPTHVVNWPGWTYLGTE